MTYRKYEYHRSENDHAAIEGIAIKNQKTGIWVVNYPKRHFSNGAAKNLEVAGCYKPGIRMMKNARQRAIDAGYLKKSIAPSYSIESLIFNMPGDDFSGTPSDIYLGTIRVSIIDQRYLYLCQN